ncbi:MAG: hypothetical protein U0359_38300 [Byssovorax sp.]
MVLILWALSPALGGCGSKHDCAAPEVYAEPGCGSASNGQSALPGAGCFVPCETEGEACSSGTCRRAHVNPCVCDVGLGCCDACGAEKLLCLP